MAERHCRKCGYELAGDDHFCPNCWTQPGAWSSVVSKLDARGMFIAVPLSIIAVILIFLYSFQLI